jgi:hypothetical protein
VAGVIGGTHRDRGVGAIRQADDEIRVSALADADDGDSVAA